MSTREDNELPKPSKAETCLRAMKIVMAEEDWLQGINKVELEGDEPSQKLKISFHPTVYIQNDFGNEGLTDRIRNDELNEEAKKLRSAGLNCWKNMGVGNNEIIIDPPVIDYTLFKRGDTEFSGVLGNATAYEAEASFTVDLSRIDEKIAQQILEEAEVAQEIRKQSGAWEGGGRRIYGNLSDEGIDHRAFMLLLREKITGLLGGKDLPDNFRLGHVNENKPFDRFFLAHIGIIGAENGRLLSRAIQELLPDMTRHKIIETLDLSLAESDEANEEGRESLTELYRLHRALKGIFSNFNCNTTVEVVGRDEETNYKMTPAKPVDFDALKRLEKQLALAANMVMSECAPGKHCKITLEPLSTQNPPPPKLRMDEKTGWKSQLENLWYGPKYGPPVAAVTSFKPILLIEDQDSETHRPATPEEWVHIMSHLKQVEPNQIARLKARPNDNTLPHDSL